VSYATREELADYIADDDLIELPGEDETDRLLADAERDVDRLLALGDRDPDSGLRLDPEALSEPQRTAVSRATCAAAAWRLHQDPEDVAGADPGVAGLPGGITLRPVGRPPGPRPLEELAGHGLPLRSGTVQPEPEDGRL
jgi:hypothetical protein